MKPKLKSKLFVFAVLIFFGALAPLSVFAQNNPEHGTPTSSTEITYGGNGLVNCGNTEADPCTLYHLFGIFARVTNFLVACAALFAIFQSIRAGQQMVLATGNPESLTTAKKALTNALLGFALVLIGFLVIGFVTSLLGLCVPKGINVITHPIDYLTKYSAPSAMTPGGDCPYPQ